MSATPGRPGGDVLSAAALWESRDESRWNAVLERYWSLVRPDRVELEHTMEQLTPAAIEHLDAEQWYAFLRDRSFMWKYTAPNRYATTTAALRRQVEKEGLRPLLHIRDRILTLADAPVETALDTVQQIGGLGPARASGLLALLYPRSFGTIDQFVTKSLASIPSLPQRSQVQRMDPNALSSKDGAVLIAIMRGKAARLNESFGTNAWTPRKIDMVLWTCDR